MDDQPVRGVYSTNKNQVIVVNEVSGFFVLGVAQDNVPFWRTTSLCKFGNLKILRRLHKNSPADRLETGDW